MLDWLSAFIAGIAHGCGELVGGISNGQFRVPARRRGLAPRRPKHSHLYLQNLEDLPLDPPWLRALYEDDRAGNFVPVANYGPPLVTLLPEGAEADRAKRKVVSALIHTERYGEARSLARLWIEGCVDSVSRGSMLIGLAIAENRLGNREGAETILKGMLVENPHNLAALANLLCIASRHADERACHHWAEALIDSHRSATEPRSDLGVFLQSEASLEFYRTTKSFGILFPRLRAATRLERLRVFLARHPRVRTGVTVLMVVGLSVFLYGVAIAELVTS